METRKALLKCKCCGKLLYPGDSVWQVRVVYWERTDTMYVPCCSEDCTKQTQQKELNRLERLMVPVRRQSFQRMTAETFLGLNL